VILLTLFLAPVLSQSAFAAIHGTNTNIDLESGRSFDTFPIAGTLQGLVNTTGNLPGDWEDGTLKWEIEFVGGPNNLWNYTYWLEGISMPANSHFTIEVSEGICNDPFGVLNPELDGSPIDSGDIECEEGEKDGIEPSLKFDIVSNGDDNHYEFQSNRSPLWHNAAFKGGQVEVHNLGFLNVNSNSDEVRMFIATPNSKGVPPGGNGIAVGGEFIGIDTTAVLAAGAQNTAAWMIPVLVAAAGLGIVIARKF